MTTDSKMVARVVKANNVNAMIKALRQAGLTVEKKHDMFICEHPQNGLLFKAAPGNNGYLVRMRSDLFD